MRRALAIGLLAASAVACDDRRAPSVSAVPAPASSPGRVAAPPPLATDDTAALLDDVVLSLVVSLDAARVSGPGASGFPARWPIWLTDSLVADADAALVALAARAPELATPIAAYRDELARALPVARRIFDGKRAVDAWTELAAALERTTAAAAPLIAAWGARTGRDTPLARVIVECGAAVALAARTPSGGAVAVEAIGGAPAADELETAGVGCAAATARYAATPGRRPRIVGIAGQLAANYLDEADRLRRGPGPGTRLVLIAQLLTYLAHELRLIAVPVEAPALAPLTP